MAYYPKSVWETGPDSGLDIQYFASETEAQALGEDVHSPCRLHKNLPVAAHPI